MKSFFKQLWWAMWNYKWCLKCHKMKVHSESLGMDQCWGCGYNKKMEQYIHQWME